MTKETAKKPERKRVRKPGKSAPAKADDAEKADEDDENPYPEFGEPPKDYDADGCLLFAQRVLNWMMIRMEKRPDEDTAASRARDARTLTELARTLERLDALERRKIKKDKKTHARDNAELKTDLIRRMDKLLAASRKNGAAGESQPG